MHINAHMFICGLMLIHCFYAIIISPLVFCTNFHSRAQGHAQFRKGGVFWVQHGGNTHGMMWAFELNGSGQGNGDGDNFPIFSQHFQLNPM